jgi:hypothetical protein
MIAQMMTTIIIRPIIDGSIERSFLERLSKNTAIDNYIDDCGCIYQKKTVREGGLHRDPEPNLINRGGEGVRNWTHPQKR